MHLKPFLLATLASTLALALFACGERDAESKTASSSAAPAPQDDPLAPKPGDPPGEWSSVMRTLFMKQWIEPASPEAGKPFLVKLLTLDDTIPLAFRVKAVGPGGTTAQDWTAVPRIGKNQYGRVEYRLQMTLPAGEYEFQTEVGEAGKPAEESYSGWEVQVR